MAVSKEKIKITKIKSQLLNLTEAFCKEHIDIEYAQLCHKMIEKMARKKSVPFIVGKIEIWAAAVIHAIGSINFLFDKNTKPFVSADFICKSFGVSKSTVGQKAKVIRDMLRIQHFDPEFSTQSILKQNPFDKIGMVNGYMVMLE